MPEPRWRLTMRTPLRARSATRADASCGLPRRDDEALAAPREGEQADVAAREALRVAARHERRPAGRRRRGIRPRRSRRAGARRARRSCRGSAGPSARRLRRGDRAAWPPRSRGSRGRPAPTYAAVERLVQGAREVAGEAVELRREARLHAASRPEEVLAQRREARALALLHDDQRRAEESAPALDRGSTRGGRRCRSPWPTA